MRRLSDGERDILAERRVDEWSALEDDTMSGHTKGPILATSPVIECADCEACYWHRADCKRAILYAAAPDMLEALRGLQAAWDEWVGNAPIGPVLEAFEHARTIIRKATGESD